MYQNEEDFQTRVFEPNSIACDIAAKLGWERGMKQPPGTCMGTNKPNAYRRTILTRFFGARGLAARGLF